MRNRFMTGLLASLLVVQLASFTNAEPVVLGIDALEQAKFEPLQGKRVGVVTNHTGLNSAGTHLVPLLIHHKIV